LNTPIDPREGNRRQKALRERLAQLASGRSKAMVGKLGQSRGRVRSMGAIGGARGARIASGARPGALNFLQQPGFGLRARDMGRGPEMRQAGAPGLVRHASNPLPSQALPGPYTGQNPMPGNLGQNPNPLAGTPDTTPGYGLPDGIVPENYNPNPDPGMSVWGVPLDQGPQGLPPGPTGVGSSSGLIPLGGGQYLDPATGQLFGVGGSGGRNAQAQ
jgi:hypothetical protein